MEAHVKQSLDQIYRLIDDCAIEIHTIRTRHWADSPERDNHQRFTNQKRKDMKVVARRIVRHLNALTELPLALDSRDPANDKDVNKQFEYAWLLGLRQLAIAKPKAASRMLGVFRQGRRSATALTRARIAVARGNLTYQADDGR